MPPIKARVGSQNAVRVLANAAAPPTRLLNLNDVNSTLKTRDGMILVWDLNTEKFYLTDTIDSSTLTITGIATFSNTTTSLAPTNGALVVSGGAGIGKQVNLGDNLSVAGISTFLSNVDIDAAVDILNDLTVNSTLKSVGFTSLASAGGITTTGGDLYANGDVSATGNLSVTGDARVIGILTVGPNSVTITPEGQIQGINNLDLQNENVSGILTTGSLDVTYNAKVGGATTTGQLTVSGQATFNSNVSIAGTLTYEDVTNVDSIGLITARTGINIGHPSIETTMNAQGDLSLGRNINVAGLSTFAGISTFSNNVFIDGTLTAGLIDGGEY